MRRDCAKLSGIVGVIRTLGSVQRCLDKCSVHARQANEGEEGMRRSRGRIKVETVGGGERGTQEEQDTLYRLYNLRIWPRVFQAHTNPVGGNRLGGARFTGVTCNNGSRAIYRIRELEVALESPLRIPRLSFMRAGIFSRIAKENRFSHGLIERSTPLSSTCNGEKKIATTRASRNNSAYYNDGFVQRNARNFFFFFFFA